MERLILKHADEIRQQILDYMASGDEDVQYLLRLNVMLLLTMKKGPSTLQIADTYGLDHQTVIQWAASLDEPEARDIAVLHDGSQPSGDIPMGEERIAFVNKLLAESPRKAGINEDQWTGAILSDHLKQKHGIELKVRMCQRWIRRLEDARLRTPRR